MEISQDMTKMDIVSKSVKMEFIENTTKTDIS